MLGTVLKHNQSLMCLEETRLMVYALIEFSERTPRFSTCDVDAKLLRKAHAIFSRRRDFNWIPSRSGRTSYDNIATCLEVRFLDLWHIGTNQNVKFALWRNKDSTEFWIDKDARTVWSSLHEKTLMLS